VTDYILDVDGNAHYRTHLADCVRLVPAMVKAKNLHCDDILADKERFEDFFGRKVVDAVRTPRATGGYVWHIELQRHAGIAVDEDFEILVLVPVDA
jgi:hypothetical protein